MAVNLFDPNYYRKANADLAKAGMSDTQLKDHFQQYGLNEGRSFSPFADLNFYRASNSDLAGMTNQQAFDHLQQYGCAEGRTFSPFVDVNFYKAANRDLAGMNNQQALEHLQQYGAAEGRTFSQFFNSDYYRRANTDLPSFNNRQLLEHLEQYGLNEGRNFSADFDANYYRNANPDLAAAGLTTNKQLYDHFRLYGIAETRASSPIFNVKSYLQDANNADLRRLNLNPTQAHEHFNLYGYQEGRFGCADYAGNTLGSARAIDLSSNSATFKDFVGANDTDDYYRFTLTKPTSGSVTLDGLGANVNVELIADANNNGKVDDKEVIKSSSNSATNKDVFSGNLNSGTYYIHISAAGTANTSYQLKLSTDAVTVENQAPVVDLNGSKNGINYAASFNKDKGAVAIVDSAKLSVTDADNTTLKSAKIAIGNLLNGEAEQLAAKTDGTKIAAKYDSKTGELSLSGDDTLANYEKVLRSLTYNNTSQNPDNADRTINFTINDGKADSEIATSTVSITNGSAGNDVLAVDLNGSEEGIDYTTSFNIGKGAVAVVDSANLSVSGGDDLASATVKISNLTDDGDELLAATTGDTKITAKYDATTGTLNLTGEDTSEHYQQVLSSVTYNNKSADPNTSERKVQFTINDGQTDSEIATSRVSFNNASVLDLNGSNDTGIDYATSFTEGGEPVAIVDSAKLTVSDVDNAQLKSAKIKIDNLQEDDELAAQIDGTKITAKYDATTGELSLSGDDTLANYQKVLRTLTYDNKSLNPDTTERQIKFTINDGITDSDIATTIVSVNAVNTTPVLDLNGSGQGIDYKTRFIIGGQAVAIVDKDNLSVTDDDTQIKSASVKITDRLDGSKEELAATKTGNIRSSYNFTTGELKLTGEDTKANYEQVLRSVTYKNSATTPNIGDRNIEFTINDGTDKNDPLAKSTVSVTAKSDIPVIDLNGSEDGKDYTTSFNTAGEDSQATPIVDSSKISITDNDSAQLKGATVKIGNLINGSDEVLDANIDDTGIKKNYDPTTGTLTLTGEADLAVYETVLGSVTYNNTSSTATKTTRNIIFTIDDGTGESEIATSKVSFNKVPVVDLNGSSVDGIDYSATFTEDKGAVPIVDKANLTVTDGDNTKLKGATVKIDIDTLKAAEDVLAATTTGNIKMSNYDAQRGILTFTGDDTLANYQKVLRSVTYNNTSQNPDTAERSITFKINDGMTDSKIATSTVAVKAVNDAPVVAVNNSIAPIFTEGDNNGATVAEKLTITDVETADFTGATVKITNKQADDLLEVDSDVLDGTNIEVADYNPTTGILTLTGDDSLANYQDVLRSITYSNSSENPNTTARNIAFTIKDSDITSNIGTSTVTVKAINDAPEVTFDSTDPTFVKGESPKLVAEAFSITDVDNTELRSATVILKGILNGNSEKLAATGTSKISSSYSYNPADLTGTLSLTGSDTLLSYQQVLNSVTYDNTSATPTPGNRTIDFTINDGMDVATIADEATVTVA